MVDIELVVVPGCPNEAPAATLLRTALDQAGLTDSCLRVTVITDERAAVRRGFAGSPTFLINGSDPFGEPAPSTGLTCRLYPQRTGPALGLPALHDLQEALKAAARTPVAGMEPCHG